MFDDPHQRTFFSAPQSVQSLIAAFLEPGITVLTFIAATLWGGDVMDRPALTLCLLVVLSVVVPAQRAHQLRQASLAHVPDN